MRERRPFRGAKGRVLRWLAAGALATMLGGSPATAQLLPTGFFDQVPTTGAAAQIEADTLAYDGQQDIISAEGDVVMHYQGYMVAAQKLSYNQNTGELIAEGNVIVRDSMGTESRMDRVHVTGGMKQAFLDSLTLTTADGSLITARDVDFDRELETILTEAHYSPCGLCIDSKGRRIGWKVNATKIVYNRDDGLIYLDNPSLELLGIPVAWLPWLALPDPTQRRAAFRMPNVNYNEKYGARLDVPYFIPIGDDIDLLLTPSLFSRQGALLGAVWTQRFDYGEFDVAASGIYQLDPSAFAGTVGDRTWRGAIQTSGRFEPFEHWRAGWSYTAFSDAAYLRDYELKSSKNVVNEVYATYLTRESYLDVRLQQFNLLGNYTPLQQEQHARAIPNVTAAHYFDLDEWGQVAFEARVLGIQRGQDHTGTYNGVPYIFAYQENKVHATVEASWQNQVILPTGVVATPYLGLRGDAAHYDGSSPLLAGPVSLLEATPIAAIDFRWPVVAVDDYNNSHLFEPVVQLVYRGTSTTLPGITNDDAQSFVFDDTNLFSYNRFSGTDRQETGLRLNVGGRYLANFDDGSWLQLIGGQSFHLAGTNAFTLVDTAQTPLSSGLEGTASYVVLGAQGSPLSGLTLGAKTQIDPTSFSIKRAGASASLNLGEASVGGDYAYIAADPLVGTILDQHEVTGWTTTPLPFDYWYTKASLSWDIASNTWLEATGGLTYDDGYFVANAFGGVRGSTHTSPNSHFFGFNLKLRGPAGEFSF